MAKFIKAEDIPADMEALFWVNNGQGTQVTFKKTVRAAKMQYNKTACGCHQSGWMTIESTDRAGGIMVW